jgi:hypothetical protein
MDPAQFPTLIPFMPEQFTTTEIKKSTIFTDFLHIYINSCSMAVPEIVFGMPDNIPFSGTISVIDFVHSGSIHSIGN